MRTKALASLLILCGSTAAVASVTAMPQDPDATSNNSTLENRTEEPAPAPAPGPTTPTPTDPTEKPKAPEKPGETPPPQ
jgi:outer membrane biosynthesis protein TonB